jgi:subtilisin inhibitor-like
VRPGGPTGPELEATLTCDPPGGTHPDAAAACAALAENEDALKPVPGHSLCTQQYGGPEEAEVTGTFGGQRVEAAFTKRNGCEIDRWERLDPLLSLDVSST